MTEAVKATTLAEALVAFQAKLPAISKDRTADTGSYSYAYADLAAISAAVLPLLAAEGLAWTTRPTLLTDGRFVLSYKLAHTSGESEEGDYPLPNGTPQQVGSAITYARRYALCAVTGIAAKEDDDDGAKASQAPLPQPTSTVTTTARRTPEVSKALVRRFVDRIDEAADTDSLRKVWGSAAASGMLTTETFDHEGEPATLQELIRQRVVELEGPKDDGSAVDSGAGGGAGDPRRQGEGDPVGGKAGAGQVAARTGGKPSSGDPE